jgi:hypothetical protein
MKAKLIQQIAFCIMFLLFGGNAFSQNPNWNENIAKIVFDNCSNCHHDGGIGPFELMSYTDAVDHAGAIKSHTQDGHMPPWKPDPSYRHFLGERKLSTAEIQAIADWVDNGTPLGPGVSPAPPIYQAGSQLNQIDISATSPAYTVQKTTDDYRTFVMPSNLTTTQYINAVEFLPSNASIVHHIILYYDPTSYSRNLDNLDPGPGYASNGTGAESPNAKLLGLWTPGADIFYLPPNMGYELPAGSDFVMELHYAPNSNAKTDSTKINLKYITASPARPVFTELALYHFPPVLLQPALIIPANTVKEFSQRVNIGNTDISLVGIFPHMHLIGKSYTLFSTKGTDTIPLLKIPDWDFHWQGFYTYQKLMKIPRLSYLNGKAVYDNTSNNPNNPSNPPITVSAGENTKDEMMVTFIAYTNYQTGDENVILDSTLLSTGTDLTIKNKEIRLYPNPATEVINVELPSQKISNARVLSLSGQLIYESTSLERDVLKISVDSFSQGVYLLELTGTDGVFYKKFSVQKID